MAEIDAGASVVTANRRLARMLRERHQSAQIERDLRVWPTPDIVPFDAWVERWWQMYCAAGGSGSASLLSPEQELFMWEGAISNASAADPVFIAAPAGSGLRLSESLAREAREAWATLCAWQCPTDELRAGVSDDVEAFADWVGGFERRCRAGGWIDRHRALDRLRASLRSRSRILPSPPSPVILAGFDSLTPQQRALVGDLMRHGVQVTQWMPGPGRQSSIASRVAYRCTDDEIEAASRWSRQLLEEGATSIAIAVPGLSELRPRIEDTFDDVLLPGRGWPKRRPFNISLGIALANIEVIADAFLILELATGDIALESAGRILRSPHLAGERAEASARAALDQTLRDAGRRRIRASRLASAAGRADLTDLSSRLARMLERVRDLPARAAPSVWAGAISELLVIAGWPGDRSADSDTHQVVEAFQGTLARLAGLSPLSARISFPSALGRLRAIAQEQLFQPESEPAPIQILGVLEACGLSFSALWLMGCDDGAWPGPARPTPLLPISLQRRMGMPHADAEIERRRCARLTTRLKDSADNVIASYAYEHGDERRRPSALIADLPLLDANSISRSSVLRYRDALRAQAPTLEPLVDDTGPSLAADVSIPGGTRVFKDQAACPFRGFAVHRLNATDVRAAEAELDARSRGSAAHLALERVWRELGSRRALDALAPDARQVLIQVSVEHALKAIGRARPGALGERRRRLEQIRLESLVGAWLDIDVGRADFEVVDPEQDRWAYIGGIRVRVRPDRIDVLADGQILVVDYKSGDPSPRAWLGERPDEPQLPLYVVALETAAHLAYSRGGQKVAGAAFAVLRRDRTGYRGMADDEDMVHAKGISSPRSSRVRHAEVPADWTALKRSWRERLSLLAEEIRTGVARVSPKAPADSTCRYCGLELMCRISERTRPGSPAGVGGGS